MSQGTSDRGEYIAPEPLPVRVETCAVCGEAWQEHLSLVRYYDDETGEELYDHVELEHCIKVLKNRFRGPVGPVGPTGAMGLSGAPTHNEVVQIVQRVMGR